MIKVINSIAGDINLHDVDKVDVNNKFEVVMSIPELEQIIFEGLPPRAQINLSSTNKNSRIRFGNIINLRARGLSNYVQRTSHNRTNTSAENKSPKNNIAEKGIDSKQVFPNIFNDLQKAIKPLRKVIKPLSIANTIDARKGLNLFLRKIALGYGVKAPQYDLAKIIKWFEHIEAKDSEIFYHLTWQNLEELGLLSRKDGEDAIRSAAKIASEAALALSSENTAEARERMPITQQIAQVAAQLNQEIDAAKTLSMEKLIQIAGKAQAAVQVVAQAARGPITKQQAQAEVEKRYSAKRELEQAIREIQLAQEAQSTQAPEQNDQALQPHRIYRRVLDSNLINILSFPKKSNLIKIFNIEPEVLINWNDPESIDITTYRDELEKLMDMVVNKEFPFPRCQIGINLLAYIQDEIKAGNKEIEKWSRENGWDIDFKNKIGDTALHAAAKQGDWDKVSLLLKADANPWIKNTEGKSLLHFAVEEFEGNAGQWLSNNGFLNFYFQNEIGDTVWHTAVKEEDWDTVGLLLKAGVPTDIKNETGDAILHVVVKRMQETAIALLLDEGANLDIQDKKGNTPLHLLAGVGRPDFIQFFLEKGAYPNIKNEDGNTPFHLVTQLGRRDMMEPYLAEGVSIDINSRNNEGQTALHLSVKNRKKDITQLILENDADVNISDLNGDTALHSALSLEWHEIVEPLLNSGARIDVKNKEGLTPLDLAALTGNVDLVRLLLEKGSYKELNVKAETATMILGIVLSTNNKKIDLLSLENGADANILYLNEETPLYLEVGEIIEPLLNKGAYIDVKNKEGLTLLDLAAQTGNVDLVRLMLEKGSYKELNVKAETATMILDIALSANDKKIGLLLLKNGVKPEKLNSHFKLRLLNWQFQAKTMEVFLGKKD